MARSRLVIVFLVLIIVIIASVIFFITRKESDSEYFQIGAQKAMIGYHSVDEGSSTFLLIARVKKIEKKDGSILAETTVKRDGKLDNFEIIILNSRIRRNSYLTLSPSIEDFYGEQQRVMVLNESKLIKEKDRLEGKLVQFTFYLNSLPSGNISCNRLLLEYLQGSKNDLSCTPFSNVMAAYEN